jgi:hypothetical protein
MAQEHAVLMRMQAPHPYRIWDLLLTVCITLVAIEIPARLVLGDPDHPVAMYFDQFITLFFLADLLLSFRRSVTIMGKTGPPSQEATRHYLTHWFTFDLLATVGYGDITPSTNAQTIYAMVVMILGVGVYGYVIGNVASLLANLDRARAHYLANLERLATFLAYRHVPPHLQRRIYEYYNHLWENRLGYDESAILAELPSMLKTEVSLALNQRAGSRRRNTIPQATGNSGRALFRNGCSQAKTVMQRGVSSGTLARVPGEHGRTRV